MSRSTAVMILTSVLSLSLRESIILRTSLWDRVSPTIISCRDEPSWTSSYMSLVEDAYRAGG